MATGRFVRTDELLKNAGALVRSLGASGDTCYITEHGKAKAVLLDINRYNALMDIVEDSELCTENEIFPDTRECISVRGILRGSQS